MKKYFYSLIIVMVAFSSCIKEENLLGGPIELTDLTLRATYKIKDITVNGTSVYGNLPDCKKGDEYIFVGGGKYNYIDVGLVCTPPSATSGSYTIVSKTQLQLDGVDYTVDSFTGLGMILTNKTGPNTTTINFSR